MMRKKNVYDKDLEMTFASCFQGLERLRTRIAHKQAKIHTNAIFYYTRALLQCAKRQNQSIHADSEEFARIIEHENSRVGYQAFSVRGIWPSGYEAEDDQRVIAYWTKSPESISFGDDDFWKLFSIHLLNFDMPRYSDVFQFHLEKCASNDAPKFGRSLADSVREVQELFGFPASVMDTVLEWRKEVIEKSAQRERGHKTKAYKEASGRVQKVVLLIQLIKSQDHKSFLIKNLTDTEYASALSVLTGYTPKYIQNALSDYNQSTDSDVFLNEDWKEVKSVVEALEKAMTEVKNRSKSQRVKN